MYQTPMKNQYDIDQYITYNQPAQKQNFGLDESAIAYQKLNNYDQESRKSTNEMMTDEEEFRLDKELETDDKEIISRFETNKSTYRNVQDRILTSILSCFESNRSVHYEELLNLELMEKTEKKMFIEIRNLIENFGIISLNVETSSYIWKGEISLRSFTELKFSVTELAYNLFRHMKKDVRLSVSKLIETWSQYDQRTYQTVINTFEALHLLQRIDESHYMICASPLNKITILLQKDKKARFNDFEYHISKTPFEKVVPLLNQVFDGKKKETNNNVVFNLKNEFLIQEEAPVNDRDFGSKKYVRKDDELDDQIRKQLKENNYFSSTRTLDNSLFEITDKSPDRARFQSDLYYSNGKKKCREGPKVYHIPGNLEDEFFREINPDELDANGIPKTFNKKTEAFKLNGEMIKKIMLRSYHMKPWTFSELIPDHVKEDKIEKYKVVANFITLMLLALGLIIQKDDKYIWMSRLDLFLNDFPMENSLVEAIRSCYRIIQEMRVYSFRELFSTIPHDYIVVNEVLLIFLQLKIIEETSMHNIFYTSIQPGDFIYPEMIYSSLG